MQMTQNSGLEPLNLFFTMLINEGRGPLRPRYRPVASETLSVLNGARVSYYYLLFLLLLDTVGVVEVKLVIFTPLTSFRTYCFLNLHPHNKKARQEQRHQMLLSAYFVSEKINLHQ